LNGLKLQGVMRVISMISAMADSICITYIFGILETVIKELPEEVGFESTSDDKKSMSTKSTGSRKKTK
jgi:hypothetical protein